MSKARTSAANSLANHALSKGLTPRECSGLSEVVLSPTVARLCDSFLTMACRATAKRGAAREVASEIENVIGMFSSRTWLQLPLRAYWLPDIEEIH